MPRGASPARLSSKQRRQVLRTSKSNPQIVFSARQYSFEATMETPPRLLAPGSGLQLWRLKARKSREEEAQLDLKLQVVHGAAGTLGTVIDTPLSTTTGAVYEGGWDASMLPDSGGENVRARLISRSRKGRAHVQAAALQWIPALSNTVRCEAGLSWVTRTNLATLPMNLRWNVVTPTALKQVNLRWNVSTSTAPPITLDRTDITLDRTDITLAN